MITPLGISGSRHKIKLKLSSKKVLDKRRSLMMLSFGQVHISQTRKEILNLWHYRSRYTDTDDYWWWNQLGHVTSLHFKGQGINLKFCVIMEEVGTLYGLYLW